MAIGRIPEPGTGIPESIIAAKGDLIVGTANDVPGILSVGTNGHTLVADSSVSPQGLKWAVDPVADVVTTAGDLLYATAADTVTRLGIGTAGQVLQVNSGATAPEWVAPAAGGASWTLLNAGGTALTGAQTITVSGISAKNDLFIIFTGASSATAQSEFRIRFNADTGNNYAEFGIGNQYEATYSTSVLNFENDSARSSIRLVQMTTSAANVTAGYLYVSGANTSGIKAVHGAGAAQGGTGAKQYAIGGYWSGAATVSSVSINSEFGNFDAGTIFVYTSA